MVEIESGHILNWRLEWAWWLWLDSWWWNYFEIAHNSLHCWKTKVDNQEDIKVTIEPRPIISILEWHVYMNKNFQGSKMWPSKDSELSLPDEFVINVNTRHNYGCFFIPSNEWWLAVASGVVPYFCKR